MASRIQVRRGTEADWTNVASSVTLAAGEPAVATGNAKGPLLYFGDGTTLFSGLKAQVASFTPQSGSNTRYGHVTATDEDYTFTMLAAGDNARALGIASGGSLTFKSGSSMTVDDTATVNFDNVPDFNKGMIAYVGEDDNSDGVTEGGTVLVKRGATEVFKVDDYGNIAVTPVDDTGTVDPNLMLKMSDNADVGLQVRNPTNDVIFAVHDNYVNTVQETILGPVPDHAIPFTFAKIRSGTNPDNTDSGALTEYLGTPHFLLEVGGDSTTNQRGKLVVVGNRNTGTGNTALQISKNGESTSKFAADYGGNLAITGQLTAQKYVVPNHPCQVRVTQTSATANYDLRGNTDATAISFTKVTQLVVSIAPASTSSKILVEVSMMGGDRAIVSTADRPEALIGTLFRKVNSGSDVDLSSANASGVVKGLFFNTHTRHATRGTVSAANNIIGQYLDTPSYSLGDTLTYTLGIATFVDSPNVDDGCDFRLNLQQDNAYHNAQASSLIKVTEIPQ